MKIPLCGEEKKILMKFKEKRKKDAPQKKKIISLLDFENIYELLRTVIR